MAQQPTAAASLYPHLKSGMSDVVQRRPQSASVADAMYLHLRPPALNPYREALLRHLREANAAADARLQREGRR